MSKALKIIMAGDHGGRHLKKTIYNYLLSKDMKVLDLGVADYVERADYPDLARPLAERVLSGEFDRGILVCGTGLGMSMVANRLPGIRAAVCANEFMARMARAHNDANILALGERVLGEGLALGMVDIFLETAFEGGRHQGRLDKF